jgi:hypothetical protein
MNSSIFERRGLVKTPLVCISVLLSLISVLGAADTLDIYVVDTEGGKAMIIVPPGGETMLVDAGYPTANDRGSLRRRDR